VLAISRHSIKALTDGRLINRGAPGPYGFRVGWPRTENLSEQDEEFLREFYSREYLSKIFDDTQ
jgi:hypothetical protein